MDPSGWRNWKEIPYRGQQEPETYKSNKPIIFSRLERRVNILSIGFLSLLSLVAISFAIYNYRIHNTENMAVSIILSVIGIFFTTAVAQGIFATNKFGRKIYFKKRRGFSKPPKQDSDRK